MLRRTLLFAVCAFAFALAGAAASDAQAQGYGRAWGNDQNMNQWERFYHYPYTYYPQNYWTSDYYKSSQSLYFRYPQEMRIPVYNRAWHNEYPQDRRYYQGHHFILDVF